MTREEGRGMVVAEGAMMDSVSETTETIPTDPGEGWRWVKSEEQIEMGDEWWSSDWDCWRLATNSIGCVLGEYTEATRTTMRVRRRVEVRPSPGTATQPAPTQAPEGATPIVDLVIADLRARAQVGLRTYGTLLHAHNGRRPDVDALQEALDLAMYQRQLVAEIDAVRVVLGASEGETLLAAAERVVSALGSGREIVDDVVAGLAKTTQHAPVLVCGTKPEDYDATAESVDGRCPHCGAVGQLEASYGLAAGGCGAYSICMACERLCDSVQDEDDEPRTEPTTYPPSAAPEPVAVETPDVVEAHHGRYRIRRPDAA